MHRDPWTVSEKEQILADKVVVSESAIGEISDRPHAPTRLGVRNTKVGRWGGRRWSSEKHYVTAWERRQEWADWGGMGMWAESEWGDPPGGLVCVVNKGTISGRFGSVPRIGLRVPFCRIDMHEYRVIGPSRTG